MTDEMQIITRANLRCTENIFKQVQALDADATSVDVLQILAIRIEVIREMMPEQSTVTRTLPYELTEGDDEPPVGAHVRDCQGDTWHRVDDGTWTMGAQSQAGWHFRQLKQSYGPLTLIKLP